MEIVTFSLWKNLKYDSSEDVCLNDRITDCVCVGPLKVQFKGNGDLQLFQCLGGIGILVQGTTFYQGKFNQDKCTIYAFLS